MKKWINPLSFYLLLTGFLAICFSYTPFLGWLLPDVWAQPFNSIIKTIGVTTLGSGLFSAIIKSNTYTAIFKDVIEDIIYSSKYINARADKRELWSKVTRALHKEKFPAISHELEEIIAGNYLPVSADYYLEDYNFSLNVSDLCEHFWLQKEILDFVIKTDKKDRKILYECGSNIDNYDESLGVEDKTSYNIDSITINGEPYAFVSTAPVKKAKHLWHNVPINLSGKLEYKVVINRTKVVCKKTNPDKRFFAKNLINKVTVKLIASSKTKVELFRSGTISEYETVQPEENGSMRVSSWRYPGLLMPNQGFILFFRNF